MNEMKESKEQLIDAIRYCMDDFEVAEGIYDQIERHVLASILGWRPVDCFECGLTKNNVCRLQKMGILSQYLALHFDKQYELCPLPAKPEGEF